MKKQWKLGVEMNAINKNICNEIWKFQEEEWIGKCVPDSNHDVRAESTTYGVC